MVTDLISTVNNQLLCLLQLAFAPVGAYSYSEGIESLVEIGAIDSEITLRNWLENSLQFGAVRVEAAVVVRALRAAQRGDLSALSYWNAWATAAKETEELRLQSWQMGRTLVRLLRGFAIAGFFCVNNNSKRFGGMWRQSVQFCDRLWHCRRKLAD
jgi:urease accessory protein UreF